MADKERLIAILNETLVADDHAIFGAQSLASYRSVAQRLAGRKLSLEPVAVELVQAALGECFGVRLGSTPEQMTMLHTIAKSILDDPAARRRIEEMWRQLSGDDGEA